MIIENSPDISILSIQVTWDISGSLPQINLLNQSSGNNLAGVDYAFFAYSPSQTPIHVGDINNPDKTGVWTTDVLNDSWPRPMNNIEYSGAPYSFYVAIKDSIGNEYTSPVQYANICRPVGNNQSSKNTYGLASSDVKVKCQEALVFFQDTTYHTYQGQSGEQVSSVLRVIYPIDETLVIPDPFIAVQYVTALVPISYSSKNYQFVQTVVYDYEVGDNCLVRVRYQTIETFAVFCNVDLMPLVCEINQLLDTVESGNCSNVADAQRKMNLIVGKFALVMIGIEQPLTGVDVPALIDEIIAIGGFKDCNCCTAPTGIIPTTASVIGGYNFLFNKLGGDIQGNWSTNGQNITLNLSDVSYVVAIGNQSPNTISAFSVSSTTSGDGYLKTYYINIDGTQLAYDILNVIAGNTALINLFNSIVIQGSGGFELIVDMGCIGTMSDACDYTFTLENIPDSPINATLRTISSSIPSNERIISYAFNTSTLPALQQYLNTLGVGVFVVTNLGGGRIEITTTNNNYNLTGITYATSGGIRVYALFESECNGFLALSANQVVQAIIDYLCGLTDSQLVTSQDYVICSIDNQSNTKVTTTINAGTKENIFLSQLLDGICNTVDYILAQNGLNCASIKTLFTPSIALMQDTDYFLGTKAGLCSRIGTVEAGTRMLQLGVYDPNFMAALCNANSLCAAGLYCEPYTIFQVSTIDTSPSSNQMNVIVTFVHPSSVSNTIRYARIDNTATPSYITIPNVLPGDSPYTISGLDDGNYFVGITPIYSDGRACGEISTTTGACEGITAFNAVINESGDIIVSYTANGSLSKVRVQIVYPSGGISNTDYTNDGNDITITPPSGVYGTFSISLIPVCNSVTGFVGVATAPVLLIVNPPSNSTFVNNTSNTLAPISMTAELVDGTFVTSFNTSGVSGGGGVISFYLADGNYQRVTITYPTGSIGQAYLTSASGVLPDSIDAASVTIFEGPFTNSGGITITAIDSSP